MSIWARQTFRLFAASIRPGLVPGGVQAAVPVGARSVSFKEWYFNLCGFNQYGLLFHDTFKEDDPVVVEAIRRLPLQAQDERTFRIARALQCTLNKTVLPKDQWTTYQDHLEKGLYLKELLAEVERERAEQKKWNSF